jgi:hypothetical protein
MKPNRTRLKTQFAARHARSVKQGIKAMFNPKDIADFWFASQHPVGNTEMNEPYKLQPVLARDWAKIFINPKSTEKLYNALGRIYADAYILGEDVTNYELARAVGIQKALPSRKKLQRALTINWNKWKPGNRAAAALVDPPDGLKRLLQSRRIVIQGLTNTTLNQIGTALAEGLKQGSTPKEVADDISYILGNDDRAVTIAQTEMSRAVVQASKDLYAESGVEKIEYLVADPCDECQENYDASPIDIGDQWPNGDPPVHPNCMCDIAPYVVDTGLWEYVYGEDNE